VFGRRGTDPATAFLHRLGEKHDLSDAEVLVDAAGYLTALFRRGLRGHLEYRERNTIEKWFQTLSIADRPHSLILAGQSHEARRWLQRFRHHYNQNRPNRALDGRTQAPEVLDETVPYECNRTPW
jgi:transposase-like protein